MPPTDFISTISVGEDGHSQGFVANPDGRGTLGILWSALAVVLLNTWTLIHANIQPPNRTETRNWLHKLNLAFIAAAAPDAIAATAFSQWRAAKRNHKALKDDLPWWTLDHAFYAEMGGYRIASLATKHTFAVRGKELAWLHKEMLIEIPEVERRALLKRSKGNPMAKIIACCQSAWFLASSIARMTQGLPLTTLEIELVPFVGVTWLVYWWWWHKPMELQTYTVVPVSDLTPEDLERMARATCCFDRAPPWWRPLPQEMHPWRLDYFWMTKPVNMRRFRFKNTTKLVPPALKKVVQGTMAEWQVADWYRAAVNEAHPNEWDVSDGWVIYLVGIWLYGFPLIAWHYEFPTEVESILWKVSNLASIAACTLWGPVGYLFHRTGKNPVAVWKQSWYYLTVIVVALGRIYIVVEVFMGLRSCPVGVFETVNWSLYIPHIL
ncbi:hypothetical protein B0T14DRAFT_571918 [Immersiella caudata]|uniref:Uncharacterized protein n=1 Tax=Immersiella caudata TaxID=314043 RepID=A0AA39W4P3_9PEZI|nr:hypothetical protein B0T14DRAFT_571918 [Immersiella caudata]